MHSNTSESCFTKNLFLVTVSLDGESLDTPLLVNVNSCGYPPEVNCTDFLERVSSLATISCYCGMTRRSFFSMQYESLLASGAPFPCHYSQSDPRLVVESYSFRDSLKLLLTSLLVPAGVLVASLAILLLWRVKRAYYLYL